MRGRPPRPCGTRCGSASSCRPANGEPPVSPTRPDVASSRPRARWRSRRSRPSWSCSTWSSCVDTLLRAPARRRRHPPRARRRPRRDRVLPAAAQRLGTPGANTVPLLVFGFLSCCAGVTRWLAVTARRLGGRRASAPGSPRRRAPCTIGASVLAFGWLVYLLLVGVFSRTAWQVLVGVVLLLVYGGVLLGVLPGSPASPGRRTCSVRVGGVGLAAWVLGPRDRRRPPQLATVRAAARTRLSRRPPRSSRPSRWARSRLMASATSGSPPQLAVGSPDA